MIRSWCKLYLEDRIDSSLVFLEGDKPSLVGDNCWLNLLQSFPCARGESKENSSRWSTRVGVELRTVRWRSEQGHKLGSSSYRSGYAGLTRCYRVRYPGLGGLGYDLFPGVLQWAMARKGRARLARPQQGFGPRSIGRIEKPFLFLKSFHSLQIYLNSNQI
jgi:hypothetical protein